VPLPTGAAAPIQPTPTVPVSLRAGSVATPDALPADVYQLTSQDSLFQYLTDLTTSTRVVTAVFILPTPRSFTPRKKGSKT
jgi:hypothetical protein